jgi:hypothetical protein
MLSNDLEKPIKNLKKYFQDKFGNVKFEDLSDKDKEEYTKIKNILSKIEKIK